jgi:transposase-like protein
MEGIEASSEGRGATDQGKRTRRHWTTEIKRRIVREAEKPGAVKQQVAERHGVHVSVLNRWRTELPTSSSKKATRRARLVSVRVSKTHSSRSPSRPFPVRTAMIGTDTMEVAFPAGQRVAIRGVVNGDALRTVLQELTRC